MEPGSTSSTSDELAECFVELAAEYDCSIPDERRRVQSQLDELDGLVETAADGFHPDHDPTAFVAQTYALAASRIAAGDPPGTADGWHAAIVERAVAALDPEGLSSFYAQYVDRIVSSERLPPEWLPWLVEDALARTVHADEPLGDDPEERLDLVVTVTADAFVAAVFLGLDDENERANACIPTVVDAISAIEAVDSMFFERARAQIDRRIRTEFDSTVALRDWRYAFR